MAGTAYEGRGSAARTTMLTEPAPTDPRRYLAAEGQIYVTASAAAAYADARGLQPEDARRELTTLLLEARRGTTEPGKPELWRFRRQSAGVDISARVSREGPLLVVVSISVRGYHAR